MQYTTDVIIIGGGVIGCAIAYFLRQKGIDVIVLERGDLGAQSSRAAVGLLAPIRPLSGKDDPLKVLQIAGIERLAQVIPALEEITHVDVGYTRTGTFRLLPAEKNILAQAWVHEWRQSGFQIEFLSSEEAHKREPQLAPDGYSVVSIADEGQLTPPQLVHAYAEAARHLGARFYSHLEVINIQASEADLFVTGVCTSHGVFTCKQLVLATGAWSAACGKWFHRSIPVRPIRGELIALKQPSPPIHHILFDEGIYDQNVYIAPKPNNVVIVGATKADVGFDTSVTAGGVHHLLDVATRLIPQLKHSAIEQMWAGLRPKTVNGSPLLGPLAGWKNVIVATGHGGFGVTLSAITGEAIAELITTGHVPELIRPFVPVQTE